MDYQINILSLFGLFGAGMTMNQFWNQIRDLRKKIYNYEQTPIYTPSELMNIKDQSKITAFVSGFIQSNSKLDFDKIWIEKRAYDLYFGQKKQLQSIQTYGLPLFNLVDSEQALVKIWRKSSLINVKPALQSYFKEETLYQLNFFEKLTNLFLRCLSILKLDKIKGFKIGELHTAYGIANGDYCTLFGDILFEKEGVSMHNLRHILKDKGQLLAHLRSILKKKKIAYSIISSICCMLMYIFSKNLINSIQQLIRQRLLNKLDKLRGIKQIQIEKYDCAICLSEPRYNIETLQTFIYLSQLSQIFTTNEVSYLQMSHYRLHRHIFFLKINLYNNMDIAEFLISMVGSSGLAYAVIQLQQNVTKLMQTLRRLESYKVYTPSQIEAMGQDCHKIVAFVAGILKAPSPIQSQRPLIISIKKIFDYDFFGEKQFRVQKFDAVNEFTINDVNSSLSILRKGSLNVRSALQFITKQYSYPPRQSFEEYGIVSGDFYVVLSEIAFEQNKSILSNPQFILHDKQQLVSYLRNSIVAKKMMVFVLKSLLLAMLILFSRNIYYVIIYLIRKWRIHKRDQLRGISQIKIDKYECVVCLDRARNIILKPCKHLALCHICYKSLELPKCPICQRNIQSEIEIYVA